MVLMLVVGRDLACFWSGRAFGGEFGYHVVGVLASLHNRDNDYLLSYEEASNNRYKGPHKQVQMQRVKARFLYNEER